MGLLDLFRPRIRLVIGDCSARSLSSSARFPVVLKGTDADGNKAPLCRIHRERGVYWLEALSASQPIRLDGVSVAGEVALEKERTYGLSLARHLILIRASRKEDGIEASFQDARWDVALREKREDRETLPRGDLSAARLQARYPDAEPYLAFPCQGSACFILGDLIRSLPRNPENESVAQAGQPKRHLPHKRPASTGAGKASSEVQACPYCWKPFAPGEALNIACHDSLTGDSVLGEHAKLRFAAERFNDLGQALDSAGTPCVDLACPHCRGRLPPSFFSQQQLILSLIGAPSSGKSYFLSVLLRLMPEELIRRYGANLQDGDPSGNAQINEMKNRLFSATSPEDAFISKTDFEGVMYERLHRDGKLVSLPRPFAYHLQRFDSPRRRASLVFYDNAGEHFKPGVALEESPGALHVAASAGLMFLFDPSTHRAFRRLLRRKRDPQLRTQATDEQDTILAELGVRVKKIRGLENHERVDTPLAMMVGKFDLWKSLLPDGVIQIPEDRPLTNDEIRANSQHVRQLLAELCPTIVANAESISSRVCYFPLSPLGHSPKEIASGPLAGRLAPDPRRLKPLLTTAPVFWILSHQAPQLLEQEAPAAESVPALP